MRIGALVSYHSRFLLTVVEDCTGLLTQFVVDFVTQALIVTFKFDRVVRGLAEHSMLMIKGLICVVFAPR